MHLLKQSVQFGYVGMAESALERVIPKPLEKPADLTNAVLCGIDHAGIIVQLKHVGDVGVVIDHIDHRIRGLTDQRIKPGSNGRQVSTCAGGELQIIDSRDDVGGLSVAVIGLILAGDADIIRGYVAVALRDGDGGGNISRDDRAARLHQ